MISFNQFFNNFLGFVQFSSKLQWIKWLLQLTALSQSILPVGWPASYQLQDRDRFDFVVVGAGSAGAVVAARLSEVAHFRVLLLEAGGDPPPASVVPSLFATLAKTEYDWDYHAKLDRGIGTSHPDGVIFMTRGKMLGGCSSNNYEVYVRGAPEDYDEWNIQAPGWDWASVLPYFKKLEGMKDFTVTEDSRNSYLHSTEGPVAVSRPQTNNYFAEVNEQVLNSYAEMGIKRILELNGPETLGASRPHFNFANGRRSSTAESYLLPAKDRRNLQITKYARVTKILIDNLTLRAFGVEVLLDSGKTINVFADLEVIISAGTIDTPKLLMLSGIGPRTDLTNLGIDCIIDLPVGKNLQDHQYTPIMFTGKRGIQTAVQNLLVATELNSYPVPIQSGFFRLNQTADYYSQRPHFQLFNVRVGATASPLILFGLQSIANYDERFAFSVSKANVDRELDLTSLILLHPQSRGEVTLKSKNPLDDPIINMGYFRDKYDLDMTVEALKFMTKFSKTFYYRKVDGDVAKLDVAGCEHTEWGSDAYWRCYATNVVGSMLHPVGTCQMGPHGVVDERLKVHGISGLRIVDGSIMPTIPGGNTNAPIMMIGEKAADLIKGYFLI